MLGKLSHIALLKDRVYKFLNLAKNRNKLYSKGHSLHMEVALSLSHLTCFSITQISSSGKRNLMQLLRLT